MTYPEAPSDVLNQALELYRDLHAHPELSGQEHRTQAAIVQALAETASDVRACGGTGLEAVLRNGDGPVVAFRADIDALPLHENTGLPYSSTHEGVMHACGHDVHTASLVGAMRWLDNHRDAWSGTLVGIFQPAEENGAGALAMLDDGLFESTGIPSLVLGQHVAAAPLGRMLVRPGWFLSDHRSYRVVLRGTGGSGCRPHLTNDVVVAAASMVLRLQTIVSREIDPFRMAVVTIGALHAGTKASVLPSEAEFTVSSHTYEPEVTARVKAAVLRIVQGEAAAGGVEVEVFEDDEISHIPAVWNDPEHNAVVAQALGAVFGEEAVAPPQDPLPASDDFGRYADRYGIPNVIWNFGVYDPALSNPPRNHDARFAPDPVGAVSVAIVGALAVLRAEMPPK